MGHRHRGQWETVVVYFAYKQMKESVNELDSDYQDLDSDKMKLIDGYYKTHNSEYDYLYVDNGNVFAINPFGVKLPMTVRYGDFGKNFTMSH